MHGTLILIFDDALDAVVQMGMCNVTAVTRMGFIQRANTIFRFRQKRIQQWNESN
jgi:hypothetical protein